MISLLSQVTQSTQQRKHQDSHDASLQQRFVSNYLRRPRGHVTKLHDIDGVVDGDIHASHHPLVVAEEENGEAANAIDGDEKATLLEVMHHIEARDLVHPCGDV